MNFNLVIIAGNLTRDPELAYTPKGTAVAKFGVAVNHKWLAEGGEKKEEVTFVNVTAWGKTAEAIGQYFKKGAGIHVQGRLKLDQWDDKQSGQKRQALSVICESFQFVGGKSDGGSSSPSGGQRSRPAPGASSRPVQSDTSTATAEPEPENPGEDDQVPF